MGISLGIVNTKGGVGKTTTAVNLAAMLADGTLGAQYQVLLIDMDPQGSASRALGGVDYIEDETRSLATALLANPIGKVRLEDIICRSPWSENLDFIPVHSASLKKTPSQLIGSKGADTRLNRLLRPLRSVYDFIVIDFLPTASDTNLLFFNALSAIDNAVIPTQLTQLAMEGLPETLNEIHEGEITYEHPIRILGVLPTEVRNVRGQKDLRDELVNAFGNQVYPRDIPLSTDVSDAFRYRLPLHQYAHGSKAAEAYIAFGKETLARAQKE